MLYTTMQRVAFIILADEGGGLMARGPDNLDGLFEAAMRAETPDQLRAMIHPSVVHQWDNYLQLWNHPEPEAEETTEGETGSEPEARAETGAESRKKRSKGSKYGG